MICANTEVKVYDSVLNGAEWKTVAENLPVEFQDPFLLPGYARAFAGIYQAPAGLFCFKAGNNVGVATFLRRSIKTLPFYRSSAHIEDWFDIISPEYSGPVCTASGDEKEVFLHDFLAAFNAYCIQNNIVTEFGRMNPYYNNDTALIRSLSATLNRSVVYIDLSQDIKDIRKNFSKGNRSSIKKAQREGVLAKRVSPEEGLEGFYHLYAQTMQRNQADKFYFFSLDFFKDLFAYLKGNICLWAAYHRNRMISASVFLHCRTYLHYYFSGSDDALLSLCPNNLLINEVIQWAQKEDFKILNLGGGYHHDGRDSLFSFKASFSSTRRDFYVYRRVHNQDVYNEFCDAFVKHSESHGAPFANGNSYFPLYRKLNNEHRYGT